MEEVMFKIISVKQLCVCSADSGPFRPQIFFQR